MVILMRLIMVMAVVQLMRLLGRVLAVLVKLVRRGHGRRRRRRLVQVVVRRVRVVDRRGVRRRTAPAGDGGGGGGGGRELLRRRRLGLARDGAGRAYLVAQNSADAGHAGHVELVAHPVGEQAVAYLPREHSRVFALQPADVRHDPRRGHPRLAAPYGPRQHAARLVVPGQYLGHAAVRDAQLSADVARPDPHPGQLDDAHANGVRQRPPVHEDAPQLVHFAVLLLLLLLL